MILQRIKHRVVDETGELVDFVKTYEVVRTEVYVWSGRNNYAGGPIEQEGITFTHYVREVMPDVGTVSPPEGSGRKA